MAHRFESLDVDPEQSLVTMARMNLKRDESEAAAYQPDQVYEGYLSDTPAALAFREFLKATYSEECLEHTMWSPVFEVEDEIIILLGKPAQILRPQLQMYPVHTLRDSI